MSFKTEFKVAIKAHIERINLEWRTPLLDRVTLRRSTQKYAEANVCLFWKMNNIFE